MKERAHIIQWQCHNMKTEINPTISGSDLKEASGYWYVLL